MWYTYVLYENKGDRFYIGFSEDLDRRVPEHLAGHTQTTARMVDPLLVYYEACLCKEDAMRRERELKTGFGRGYLRRRLQKFLENEILPPTRP